MLDVKARGPDGLRNRAAPARPAAPRYVLEQSDERLRRRLAETNMIMTLPSRAAEPLMRASGLSAFPPPLALAGFDYRLPWRERSQADRGHRGLRELVFAQIG